MNTLKSAWQSLDTTGRIILIACLTIVVVALIAAGVDLAAVAAWLGGN